jgi:hypothetical protein
MKSTTMKWKSQWNRQQGNRNRNEIDNIKMKIATKSTTTKWKSEWNRQQGNGNRNEIDNQETKNMKSTKLANRATSINLKKGTQWWINETTRESTQINEFKMKEKTSANFKM